MNILTNKNTLAYVISPAVTAVLFYLIALLLLDKGEYLPGIEILFFVFALPLSYLGVFTLGLPGLRLLQKMNILNHFSFLAMSFFAGLLTAFLFFSIVGVLQKVDDFRELYSSGLEPILIAGVSAVGGAFLFLTISGILEKQWN